MPLDAIAGRAFGPFATEVSRPKAAELVAASGDDPDRWREFAPPSYAATVIFAAAPAFFADPDVGPHLGSMIHSDQRYQWHRPFAIGAPLLVQGRVASVRSRRELNFVEFHITAQSDGEPIIDLESVFVIAEGGAPAAAEPEAEEPAAGDRRQSDIPARGAAGAVPPMIKSASRADLVRYAGATGDFNPIHWDHDAARRAGLAGVIVHGLLTAAWMMQSASQVASDRPDPLAAAKVRFRRALRPAAEARVEGEVSSPGTVKLSVTDGTDPYATGSATVR